jgi:hypothetical protein
VYVEVLTRQLSECTLLSAAPQEECWTATPRLKQFVLEKERRIISSQLAEDGFNCLRRQESSGSNKQVSGDRAFAALIDDQTLSNRHDYNEVTIDEDCK